MLKIERAGAKNYFSETVFFYNVDYGVGKCIFLEMLEFGGDLLGVSLLVGGEKLFFEGVHVEVIEAEEGSDDEDEREQNEGQLPGFDAFDYFLDATHCSYYYSGSGDGRQTKL